jgi:hypothetical protein
MSALLSAGIGAVTALLLANGFKKVEEKFDARTGNTILKATREDGSIQNVQLKNNAVISPQYDFIRIGNASAKRSNSNSPQYELKNESSVIKRIFSISIVPDATFKAEGFLAITLNGAPFFPITNGNAGDFQDVDSITIPIPDTYGLKILPKDKLKVFIWSATGAVINASIAVFIGELP